MATDINAKKNASHELSSRQEVRSSDREWIIARIDALLDDFYREDLGEAFNLAAQMQWADVLEGLPRDAINKGCIDYQRNGPRSTLSGKLIKPAAGDIYAFARTFVPKPKIVSSGPVERERHIPSHEEKLRVQQMIKEAGHRVQRVDKYQV